MVGRRLVIPLGCLCAGTIASSAISSTAVTSRPDHIGAHQFVYSAHADVDGDGQLDHIVLTRHPAMTGHLVVTLATGRRLALKMQSDAPFVPGLATTGNVNARRGDELFVDLHHLTTAEVIGVFTFAKGRLGLAGKVFAYGNDLPIHWGVNCATHGTKQVVVDHQFQLHIVGTRWRWTRKDVFFVWRGSALRKTGVHGPMHITGHPPKEQVGVHCGQAPTR